MVNKKDISIFLLHGLGAHTISLLPLEIALNYAGWSRTHKISYPVDSISFEESLDYVYQAISENVSKDDPIIIVGQSMGGVVANNLHRYPLNIVYTITIGSPLHGANLLNQLEAILPKVIVDYFNKIPYDYLKLKSPDGEPPHPYHNISMGWAWSDFDGCVYREEAILDKKYNTHLAWMDHRTGFANPRLWLTVTNLLEQL